MLPRVLCEHLCSLNCGVDRLAFSAFFRMRSDGSLVDHKPSFARTVIRSVAKLDYGTAQEMIACKEDEKTSEGKLNGVLFLACRCA